MGFLSSLFGVGSRTPSQQTVVQSQKLPPELAPFIKEILGEAQDLYKGEIERGYDPYTGQMIAPLTGDEQRAMEGISGLVGTTKPFIEEALETYRTGAEKFTPEAAEEYMSPYQRAVTDIEKREAQTNFERNVMPRFEAEAIRAGGLSGLGSRAGVEAAELQRGQSQLLADIEAKGLQSAFKDAQQQFAQQKARERQMAGDIGRTGPAMFQAGLAEQGALQTVGQQKRELAQSALDEAYGKFLEERAFPQQTLADYSGMVYGNPYARGSSFTKTQTGTPGAPGIGQQLLGLGLTGLNIYGAGTMGGTQGFNWGAAGKGMLRAKGGRLNGLSGLPMVRRQNSGGVWEDLEQIDVVERPSGEEIYGMSEEEALKRFPSSDVDRARKEGEKTLSDLSTMFGRQSQELEAQRKKHFDKRRERLGEKDYPFATIQSAIAAGMQAPTIAMGLIEGTAKAAELGKAEKKEAEKLELELEKEEFGVERQDLNKKQEKAFKVFEKSAALRKKLFQLPEELRTKVLAEISTLTTIEVNRAKIEKLIAEAKEALRGDTKGYTLGIRGDSLPDMLKGIINPDTGKTFMPAGKQDLRPAGLAAQAEAIKIIDEAGKKWGTGKKSGTVYAAQQRALNSDEGKRRMADAYAAAKKSPTAKGGNVGGNTARSIGDRPPRSSVDSILKQYTP